MEVNDLEVFFFFFFFLIFLFNDLEVLFIDVLSRTWLKTGI